MTKLRIDSRDTHFYRKYGTVLTVPQESNFGDILVSTIEPSNGEDCTALSVCKVCTSQSKIAYDLNKLWSEVSPNNQPVDPRTTLSQMVKGMPELSGTVDTRFKSYWRADTGSFTPFVNVQSAMNIGQSSCLIASKWYEEWDNLSPLSVMLQGQTYVSNHCYVFVDWKLVNGVVMAMIDAHLGYFLYMPQDIFNQVISDNGLAFMPSQTVLDTLPSRNLAQLIINSCENVIQLLQELLTMQTSSPNPTSTLDAFCNAITNFEGSPGDPNYKNNNPGNCRCSKVGYRAVYGDVKCSPDNFAIFPTFALGYFYLENTIRDFIQDHPEWTILQLMETYAPSTDGNDPAHYADVVSKEIGLSITTTINKLL